MNNMELNAWVEINYVDAWYPEGNKCILTSAKPAIKPWERDYGFMFAIFGLDGNPHVAYWPNYDQILSSRPLSRKEAEKWLWKTANSTALDKDFQKYYGKLF